MDGAGAFSLLVGLAEANVMGTLEYALVSEEYTSSYLLVGGSESWLDRMGEEAVSVRRSYIMKSITLDWKGALRLLYI